MSKEINLLIKRNPSVSQETKDKYFLIFRIGSFGMLIFSVVLVLIMIFLRSQSSLSDLTAEAKSLSSQLSLLNTKAAKYLLINERLNLVSVTLDKRTDLEKLVGSILQDMPSNVAISSLSVNNAETSISITSPSLLSINQVVEHFLTLAKEKKIFSSVVMDSLNFDSANNVYSISLKARI